jgi:hypothetical protein
MSYALKRLRTVSVFHRVVCSALSCLLAVSVVCAALGLNEHVSQRPAGANWTDAADTLSDVDTLDDDLPAFAPGGSDLFTSWTCVAAPRTALVRAALPPESRSGDVVRKCSRAHRSRGPPSAA